MHGVQIAVFLNACIIIFVNPTFYFLEGYKFVLSRKRILTIIGERELANLVVQLAIYFYTTYIAVSEVYMVPSV